MTYAHMCRDGHPEVGYNDSSEDERCPVCRARDLTTHEPILASVTCFTHAQEVRDGMRQASERCPYCQRASLRARLSAADSLLGRCLTSEGTCLLADLADDINAHLGAREPGK